MAVSRAPQNSQMIITIQNGVNASGQAVYQKRTYKSVKSSAIDTDVYDIAQAMANLQKHPVTGISRLDEGNLVNA